MPPAKAHTLKRTIKEPLSYANMICSVWETGMTVQAKRAMTEKLVKEGTEKAYRVAFVAKRRTYADTRKELRQALAHAEMEERAAQQDFITHVTASGRPHLRAVMHRKEQNARTALLAYERHKKREYEACHQYAIRAVEYAAKELRVEANYQMDKHLG